MKRSQRDLAAATLWAQIALPIGAVPVRPTCVGAFLDLLRACGALVRWRCDARNAEQNITGLEIP